MADVNRGNRPLSPHLSIYRPQLTSVTSILTRITGNALLIGALLVVWWLLAAATSPEYFAVANWVMTRFLALPFIDFDYILSSLKTVGIKISKL